MPETWKIVVAIVLVAVFFLFIYYRHVSDLKREIGVGAGPPRPAAPNNTTPTAGGGGW